MKKLDAFGVSVSPFLARFSNVGKELLSRLQLILQPLVFLEKLDVLLAKILSVTRIFKSLFCLCKLICRKDEKRMSGILHDL